MLDLMSSEQLHATTIKYLFDGGEHEAATLLTLCSINSEPGGYSSMRGSYSVSGVLITTVGPRLVCDVLRDTDSLLYEQIRGAFNAVLAPYWYVDELLAALEPVTLTPGWKEEAVEQLRSNKTFNQARDHSSPPPRQWNGLGFRSLTEVAIANELDKAGVMFFPIPAARVTVQGEQRGNRFPDFLVCQHGKWGILEVDGEPYHPPGTAARDHDRDRLFKQYGMTVVEHFTAHECYTNPAGTVSKFLTLLAQNG